MLEDENIDAVSICVWNNLHADITIAALNAGKHVLVEKPPSINVNDAKRMEEAVTDGSKILHVGFVLRHAIHTRTLKKFINQGELGDIYFAKASWLKRSGNPGGWFAHKNRSGGGPLIDLGIHMIDICWYLMGKPKVKAVTGHTYRKLGHRSNIKQRNYSSVDYDHVKNDVEDLANALITFENGASLLVDVSFSLHTKQDQLIAVQLFGDKGGAELQPDFTIVSEKYDTILSIQPDLNEKLFDFDQAFRDEIAHFVNCCIDSKKTITPIKDGVEIMKILCGIYESSETGKQIIF